MWGMDNDTPDLRLMTADIVAAYVGSRNHVTTTELPNLISTVHAALSGLGTPSVQEPVKAEPAVSLRKAVQPDAITCLFDGKAFKSLKRHLANEHQMSPAEYRDYWGLPKDSAMVAPNYAKARSDMARSMGLGQGRRAGRPATAPVEAAAKTASVEAGPGVAPPKRRGRPPKAPV